MEWKLTWIDQAIAAVVRGPDPHPQQWLLGPTGGRRARRFASIVKDPRLNDRRLKLVKSLLS